MEIGSGCKIRTTNECRLTTWTNYLVKDLIIVFMIDEAEEREGELRIFRLAVKLRKIRLDLMN